MPDEAFIQLLLTNRLMLLPFTMDPWGGFGHFANLFLHGQSSPPLPSNWYKPRKPNVKKLLDLLPAAPRGLLPKANKAYSATLPKHQQPTYTPTQWALKTLATNTSLALASHIHKMTTKAYRSLHSDADIPLVCHFDPYKALPVETHTPLPHFALPVVA